MADNRSDNQTPQPAPRRRSSKKVSEIGFVVVSEDKARASDAARPEVEAPEFSPRAMLPDGSPAAPPRKKPKTPATPSPKRKRSRATLLPVTFAVLLIAVLSLFVYSLWTDPARSNTYYEGVNVGGIALGGMTQEQAAAALSDAQSQILSEWKVTLRYGEETWTVMADDIAMQMNMSEQLAAAWKLGREGNYTERKDAIEALKQEPYHATGGVTYDAALLEIMLDQLRGEIDAQPVDASASFTPQNEQPFQFVDEINGRKLDTAALQAEIDGCITSLRSAEVELQPEVLIPAVTRAALQANLTCIVVVTTDIAATSTEGRNENIRIALGKLDGKMVAPSSRMSFNDTVGKRSDPANGYHEALEIAYGEYVQGIGGGVCQVSTTLYQAVLRSGLQVLDRSAHAVPSGYAERGQDATVSDNGSDLVFRNSTEYPVYIRARLVNVDEKGKQKRCEIAIYGRPLPDGIRYSLETRQIGGDIEPDPAIEYIADRQQELTTYTDQQKEYLPKRLGYRVETFLLTKRGDGMVTDSVRISEDYYKPRAQQIYVGVTPRN